MGIENLPLFITSCILLNITPGQDTVYIVGRSIAQGRKAGIVSVLGIMSGILLHTLFAALGLSVILSTSALAFQFVKFIGAAYLIWIGIDMIRQKPRQTKKNTVNPAAPRLIKIYRQGVLTNLLNPKVALFFLSFLPQFVSPQAASGFGAFLSLGMILFTTGTVWCMVLVYGAEWITRGIKADTGAESILKKLTGMLFIGIGLKIALLPEG